MLRVLSECVNDEEVCTYYDFSADLGNPATVEEAREAIKNYEARFEAGWRSLGMTSPPRVNRYVIVDVIEGVMRRDIHE